MDEPICLQLSQMFTAAASAGDQPTLRAAGALLHCFVLLATFSTHHNEAMQTRSFGRSAGNCGWQFWSGVALEIGMLNVFLLATCAEG